MKTSNIIGTKVRYPIVTDRQYAKALYENIFHGKSVDPWDSCHWWTRKQIARYDLVCQKRKEFIREVFLKYLISKYGNKEK